MPQNTMKKPLLTQMNDENYNAVSTVQVVVDKQPPPSHLLNLPDELFNHVMTYCRPASSAVLLSASTAFNEKFPVKSQVLGNLIKSNAKLEAFNNGYKGACITSLVKLTPCLCFIGVAGMMAGAATMKSSVELGMGFFLSSSVCITTACFVDYNLPDARGKSEHAYDMARSNYFSLFAKDASKPIADSPDLSLSINPNGRS